MNEIIKSDLYRYVPYEYSFRNLLKGFLTPGFLYTFILRKAVSTSKKSLSGLWYRLLHRFYSHKYGFQIPVPVKIGEGFYIGHFGNVIVSPQAVIGRNCNISPGVTVGRIGLGKRAGAPVIGNNVWMGTNSVIVGGIKIGSDVLIAPCSFVNFDVPDHSLVIGNPGKIVPKDHPTMNYITNVITEKYD